MKALMIIKLRINRLKINTFEADVLIYLSMY